MGKLATFHFGREASIAAKQVIHGDKHQTRREHHQPCAAQRFQMDKVQVGRHRQVAGKFMVRLNADGPDGYIRATTQQVEQPHTKMAGKALINDFQRLQTFAHNPSLGIRIVRTNVTFAANTGCRFVFDFAVAIQQRINFSLRKNTIAHVVIAE